MGLANKGVNLKENESVLFYNYMNLLSVGTV